VFHYQPPFRRGARRLDILDPVVIFQPAIVPATTRLSIRSARGRGSRVAIEVNLSPRGRAFCRLPISASNAARLIQPGRQLVEERIAGSSERARARRFFAPVARMVSAPASGQPTMRSERGDRGSARERVVCSAHLVGGGGAENEPLAET
jgi:hypothetical protein